MYDLIGDIHGHADALTLLLENLGYQKEKGVYQHVTRKAIFLGDFVDRGPHILETLEVVRPMVEQGHALAVMGNHEYNAICYQTPTRGQSGSYLREHTKENQKQFEETLAAFKGNPELFGEYIEWFEKLPLFLELIHPETRKTCRVVHACWSDPIVDQLKAQLTASPLQNGFNGKQWCISEDFLHASAVEGSEAFAAIETLLKGPEVNLPEGMSYLDKGEKIRKKFRLKWWAHIQDYSTLENIALSLPDSFKEKKTPLPAAQYDELRKSTQHLIYSVENPPVFFGHYWLKDKTEAFTENICCLDYSIADHEELDAEKRRLAAYKWEGEGKLNESHLVFVSFDQERATLKTS